jgi:hypothetical protein
MKSQMLAISLMIISAFFFQPTHQYRLSKRELTEYDLTSFIVSTCSARKTDMLIQGLCEQTLQSALMGNFPFLTYYCNTIGAGMSYCNIINRQTLVNQNAGAKQGVFYRRHVRSLNEDNNMYRKEQEMNIETGFEEKLIIQKCITKTEENSGDMDKFCNRTLQEVQRGRYPEIKHFCKYHLGSDYCRHVRLYSLLFPWSLSQSSSLLSSSSSSSSAAKTHSNAPSFISSSIFKPSDSKSIID